MAIDNPVWDSKNKEIQKILTEKVLTDSQLLKAMETSAHKEINHLQEHANLLVKQAKEIMDRVQLTKRIHEKVNILFHIVKEKPYFLYTDDVLSMISPEEWDKKESAITVKQLGDGTWDEVKNLEVNREMS
jgi:ElaB/YqjD/DUF883 family membrane-anchored ribosome-binding protein|tara:strand:- start:26 stop:418 length:393 start_codon:yes stop_codon:yes gene_type:complete